MDMRPPRPILILGIAATLLAATAASMRGSSTGVSRSLGTGGMRADSSLRDPIARLQARLDAGEITLRHDSAFGYLPALLNALHIPTSSQSLVFSRTSLQSDLIAPWVPRALYFNDDVYVGFVRESDFLEIATVSPEAGVAFYTLMQDPRGRPAFLHETSTCLLCHQSRATGNIPGFIMLSSITDRSGYPLTNVHSGSTTDATPIRQRFGGWYVTGTDGATGHSGNVHSLKDFNQLDKALIRNQLDLTTESARTTLDDKFTTSLYPTAHSDLVALMVLVHQTSVHNLMAIVSATSRKAVMEEAIINKYRGDSVSAKPFAETNVGMRDAIEQLVRAMLFVDAVPLESPMNGTTNFVEDFEKRGPRDAKGRSLRDFDLRHRLFKYPLSFLIYSEGFAALPVEARDGVYARLRTILAGRDANPDYAKISPTDRTAIADILRATIPDYTARMTSSALK